ncbi:MAG: phosphate ABC transporter substrate-binding protein [Acidobacteriota bacterium]
MNHRTARILGSILIALALVVALGPLAAQQARTYQVIVHPNNPVGALSSDQISRMLLKRVKTWESGVAVAPVDLVDSSSVREAFSREVHGRSIASIKNYWQRNIFSGRAVPPPEVPNEDQAIAFVRSNPGGIGYVSSGASTSGVKVITISE